MKRLIVLFLLISNLSMLAQHTVPMINKSGVFYVPCKVNGISLNFILDTGASDVSISLSEALFMIKNGYIDEHELLGNESYRLANGEITEGTRIILRKIEIGDVVLNYVAASIVHTIDAPLLLGQSALKKFGDFSIDYSNNLLVIGKVENKISKEELSIIDSIANIVYNDENHKSTEPLKDISDCFVRANLKYDLGDSRGAIQDYNKAIEIDPNNAFAYYNRGNAKSKLGDYRGAIQDFNKSIEINSKLAPAYIWRGIIKKRLGDYRGAIQDYNKTLEIDPNDASAYYNRGIAKSELGDNRGAIQDLNKSLEINFNLAPAYTYRGIIKGKLGDYRGAILDLNKAIVIDPNDAQAYLYRGIAKNVLSDINGSCLDFSKAGELGAEDAYELIREYCK